MSKFLAITILITTVALGHAQEDTSDCADMTNNVTEMWSRTGRIWGGNATTIEEVPWQVALICWRFEAWRRTCGGSIISENWAITAAHCVPRRFICNIRAGITNLKDSGSRHFFIQTIRHPLYNTSQPQFNDIALIEVKQPFRMDKTRQAVPLFMENEILPVGSLVNVSGWGLTQNYTYPFDLNIVEVPIIPMSECRRLYHRIASSHDGFFCAAVLESGRDSCKGDSGGPVTLNGRLLGMVSAGPVRCGFPGSAGLYTEIAYFRGWIKDTCNV